MSDLISREEVLNLLDAKHKTVTEYPTFDEWKATRAESEE